MRRRPLTRLRTRTECAAISYSHIFHARAVRPRRKPGVRRVRGRRIGNPGAGCPPAPAGPAGPAREPLLGLPGTFEGPLGCLAAPAWRRFVSRSVCFGFPLRTGIAPAHRDHTLSHLRRPAGPRHYWRFAAGGRSGPPGSRAFRWALLPGAGRCHVKDGCIHVPSQATTRALCHSPPPPGISPPHGYSRSSSRRRSMRDAHERDQAGTQSTVQAGCA